MYLTVWPNSMVKNSCLVPTNQKENFLNCQVSFSVDRKEKMQDLSLFKTSSLNLQTLEILLHSSESIINKKFQEEQS